MATRTRNPGTDWFASCTPDPIQVHRAWALHGLACIDSGQHWTAVEADLMPTITAMEHIRPDKLGPVLVHPGADRAWWLLPLDADELLSDLPRLTVRPAGWALHCPPADRYVNGMARLEKPDGSGNLTDPAALGAAFGPGGGTRLPAGVFC